MSRRAKLRAVPPPPVPVPETIAVPLLAVTVSSTVIHRLGNLHGELRDLASMTQEGRVLPHEDVVRIIALANEIDHDARELSGYLLDADEERRNANTNGADAAK